MSDCNSDKVISGIHCDVSDCAYNCGCKCTAGEIHVGPQSATSTSETDCETFRLK